MEVTLINYTQMAAETLIFTKQTRLNMTAMRFQEVLEMTEEAKLKELAYMADTIPSSWEFVDYIFAIEGVSRAFTHQFVRTRTNSYAQQSMRVTDMGEFDYVTGPGIDDERQSGAIYWEAMGDIKRHYKHLIDIGVPIEDARGILPTNICTNIVAKINLRTLSDLARSRTGGRTQNEYQEVLKAMIEKVLEVHPWARLFLFPKGEGFFDEIEDFARSIEDAGERQKVLKIIDKMRKRA